MTAVFRVKKGTAWVFRPYRRLGPQRYVQPLWTGEVERAYAWRTREAAERFVKLVGDGAEVERFLA